MSEPARALLPRFREQVEDWGERLKGMEDGALQTRQGGRDTTPETMAAVRKLRDDMIAMIAAVEGGT